MLIALPAAATGASDIVVTRVDDPVPAPPCLPEDCTLRSAILSANSHPGWQVIHLPPGAFDLNLTWSVDGWYEDAGQTADIDVTDDVAIIGAGVDATTLATNASQAERALDIHADAVSISDLTIRDLPYTGNPLDCGRAIRNESGNLTIRRVALVHNTMRGNGGAICGGGIITIEDSTISGNCACFSGYGGGILSSGDLKLVRVLLEGNRTELGDGGSITGDHVEIQDSVILDSSTTGPFSSRRGGGIAANSLTISNTTISGNRAGLSELGSTPSDSRGGGVFVWEEGLFTNVTIADNESGLIGGGLAAADGAQVTIRNSIISGNTGGDCLGLVTSGGHNIAGDSTCGFAATGDINATDPLLGPLLPVGSTYAHPLLPGSPALDSADAALCPSTDQRGVTRPQNLACDRGAYEVIPAVVGDVDCNNGRTLFDVLALVLALADVRGAGCLSAADVNGDHTIDMQDAVGILLLL